MGDFLFNNWKMTLAGIIGATANLIIAYLQGQLDAKTFLISFIIATLGVLGKDGDKSGTLKNPR